MKERKKKKKLALQRCWHSAVLHYKRLAYGNDTGLVVVDIVQKVSLLVMCTSDLGGSSDPQRTLRSPKRQEDATAKRDADDKARSPSIDQVKCLHLLSSLF